MCVHMGKLKSTHHHRNKNYETRLFIVILHPAKYFNKLQPCFILQAETSLAIIDGCIKIGLFLLQ